MASSWLRRLHTQTGRLHHVAVINPPISSGAPLNYTVKENCSSAVCDTLFLGAR